MKEIRILVTGASGYIGSALFTSLQKQYKTMGTFQSNGLFPSLVKLDLCSLECVKKTIQEIRPNIIVHTAAHASVRWCEEHPKEAIELNVTGTKNLVEMANQINSRLILISSTLAHPLRGVYTQTKWAQEQLVKNIKTEYMILRASLTIGVTLNQTGDRPFNRILRDLQSDSLIVYYDRIWKFQPTWITHLEKIVLELIRRDVWNNTVPVITPEIKNRFEIAKDLLTPFGKIVRAKDDESFALRGEPYVSCRMLQKLKLPMYSYETVRDKILNDLVLLKRQ